MTNVDASLYGNNTIVFEWDPFLLRRRKLTVVESAVAHLRALGHTRVSLGQPLV